MTPDQVLSPAISPYEEILKKGPEEASFRPKNFEDFVGQDTYVKNLQIFIAAAKAREGCLDHVLFHGPPGLGKTTLAHLIAAAGGNALQISSGPMLSKTGDLVALLSQLSAHDVLFVDEIHRLPIGVEEVLYGAMEDRRIDIMIGQGPQARSLHLTLPPFTLVGATTRLGLLSSPLRDRFGILIPLSFYAPKDLYVLLRKASAKMFLRANSEALMMVAKRSRGTPRLALRLLRRVADFALVERCQVLNEDIVMTALARLGVSPCGLDGADEKYLQALGHFFQGGPAGVETLSATLFESTNTLEEVIEPFLLQQGFIQRTPRGRKLTQKGWDHIMGGDSLFAADSGASKQKTDGDYDSDASCAVFSQDGVSSDARGACGERGLVGGCSPESAS